MPDLGGFQSKEERETAIASFVTAMVNQCSKETQQDRERWQLALNLFKGVQDFGGQREENPAFSKVFMHEFSKIVRRAAQAAQDLIFERAEWFDLLPPKGEEQDDFGKIIEKIVRYRVSELDMETFTYDLCLAGGCLGVGIAKLVPDVRLEPVPELVINKINQQAKREVAKSSKKIQRSEVIMPDEMAEGELQAEASQIMDKILGPDGGAVSYKPELKARYQEIRRLKLEVVNPQNYYFEPDCKDLNKTPWEAEKNYVKLYQLEALFKSGVLDKSKKDKLKNTIRSRMTSGHSGVTGENYEGQKLNERDQYTAGNGYTPNIEVIEYHGPLLSKDGELLQEDCWFVVANGTVVLKDGVNSNWSKKTPYYKTVFSRIPFKAVGAGIADNAIDQQLLTNNLMSLLVDLMTLTAMGVKVANIDEMANPEQLEAGITPGMVIPVRGDNGSDKVITDLKFNPDAAYPIIQVIEKLTNSGAAGSGVDVSSSNPSSRARISAAEIQSNVDRSVTSLMSLARELDRWLIQETVTRVLDYVLQYDFERVALEELKSIGVITDTEYQLLVNIPPLERFNEIRRNYQIQIRGFREKLERNDFLSRLVEFVQQINVMPAAQQKINWNELLTVLVEAYFKDRVNTDRLIVQNTPFDEGKEENAILRTGHFVSIGEADQHDQHLMAHYEELMSAPQEMIIAHARAHVAMLQQAGIEIPPPPPEIQELLFGLPEEQPQQAGPQIPQLPQPETNEMQ
jgi:hypothetical protein